MAGIKRFEEIEAWKEARRLTREVYKATRQDGFRALDQEYIGQQSFDTLFEITVRVKNLVSGFIRYLRSRPRCPNIER